MVTWAEPGWLAAGAGAVVVLGLLYLRRERRMKRALDYFCARRWQNRNALVSFPRERWRVVLALLGVGSVAAALARPLAGEQEVVVLEGRSSAAALILLDVSRSMLADDVAPDRLTQARFFGKDLLAMLAGTEVGLAVFAGEARVLVPPTYDHELVEARLRDAGPALVGRGGTNMENALHEALAVLGPLPHAAKSVFLLSDGEDLEGRAGRLADILAESGIVLHTVVFGTEEGSPIRVEDGRGGWAFIRDPETGWVVQSRARPGQLAALAAATGGQLMEAAAGALPETRGEWSGEETTVTMAAEWFWLPSALAFLLLTASVLINPRRRVHRAPAAAVEPVRALAARP
jgi:Ca-activated chloride channel family protein